MSEIDWSKAPEAATHAGQDDLGRTMYFYRIPGVSSDYEYWNPRVAAMQWNPGRGIPSSSKLIPRPSPAWSGEGLPPVGTVCEWEHEANKGNWHKAEIKYIGSTYVIVADFAGIEQHYYLRSMQFRPIRAAEQIAADEREAAVAEMQRVIAESDAFVVSSCEALYDAGYRKQEVK